MIPILRDAQRHLATAVCSAEIGLAFDKQLNYAITVAAGAAPVKDNVQGSLPCVVDSVDVNVGIQQHVGG